jgi:hypothetical protein
MYSIDAYSRPGRGTRAQRLGPLGVMGRIVDAGIAGHSGDILVGSWPCTPALVPLLGTRSSMMLVGWLIACPSTGNTTSAANTTPTARRARRERRNAERDGEDAVVTCQSPRIPIASTASTCGTSTQN